MAKTSSYHESLLEALRDPAEAVAYLNGALEDYPEGFLNALRNVAQARQMAKVAQDSGVPRESLYRALSDDGNPTWDTLTAVLAALGLRLSIASGDAVVKAKVGKVRACRVDSADKESR
jgi:probable addiction module antidote protein